MEKTIDTSVIANLVTSTFGALTARTKAGELVCSLLCNIPPEELTRSMYDAARAAFMTEAVVIQKRDQKKSDKAWNYAFESAEYTVPKAETKAAVAMSGMRKTIAEKAQAVVSNATLDTPFLKESAVQQADAVLIAKRNALIASSKDDKEKAVAAAKAAEEILKITKEAIKIREKASKGATSEKAKALRAELNSLLKDASLTALEGAIQGAKGIGNTPTPQTKPDRVKAFLQLADDFGIVLTKKQESQLTLSAMTK